MDRHQSGEPRPTSTGRRERDDHTGGPAHPPNGGAQAVARTPHIAPPAIPGADVKWDPKAYAEFIKAQVRVVQREPKDDSGITLLDKDSNWLFSNPNVDDADQHPKVLIRREWHDALWERFKESTAREKMRFAVIGTSGIGVSAAINVMVHRLLLDAAKSASAEEPPAASSTMNGRRYVVAIFPKHDATYVFDTASQQSARIAVDDCAPARILEHLDPKCHNTVVLDDVDVGRPVPAAGNYPCVHFATPTDPTKAPTTFLENGADFCFFAPVYNFSELLFVAEHVWSVPRDELIARDTVCGSVPSLVFGPATDREAWQAATDAALVRVVTGSVDLCKRVLEMNHVDGISQFLYVVGPTKSYEEAGVDYLKATFDYLKPTLDDRSLYTIDGVMNPRQVMSRVRRQK
jgi:hypothetical protein